MTRLRVAMQAIGLLIVLATVIAAIVDALMKEHKRP